MQLDEEMTILYVLKIGAGRQVSQMPLHCFPPKLCILNFRLAFWVLNHEFRPKSYVNMGPDCFQPFYWNILHFSMVLTSLFLCGNSLVVMPFSYLGDRARGHWQIITGGQNFTFLHTVHSHANSLQSYWHVLLDFYSPSDLHFPMCPLSYMTCPMLMCHKTSKQTEPLFFHVCG